MSALKAKVALITGAGQGIGRLEEDIGRAIFALCESDLFYVTGATIPLDDGQANFD